MLTIAPEPLASMVGSTCLQPRKTLFRFASTCESHTSSDSSTGHRRASVRPGWDAASRCPQHAVAELVDQPAGEGQGVAVGWPLSRRPLAAAHLDMEALVVHQREQGAEGRLVEAERGVDTAHVADHHRHRRAPEVGREVGQQAWVAMDLQMPAERLDAAGQRQHVGHRCRAAEMAHEVEAHATEAGSVEATTSVGSSATAR